MDSQTNLKVFDTPVLLLIFNRPDVTERVFAEIRKLKPKRLFIAADGPRAHKPNDPDLCLQTRNMVKDVDWDCEVKQLYRNDNLGCKLAVSSAITWFFSQVEYGIILEDDILPHPSFFPYMQEVLKRYKDDDRVMMVSGYNTQHGQKRSDASYYFSHYPHIWGWGTWKRAWDKYDVKIDRLAEFKRQNQIANLFDDPVVQEFWMDKFQMVHDNKYDTWDFQWVYTVFSEAGLCVQPNVNLVSNIGFDMNATHTTFSGAEEANLQTYDIGEIVHPDFIIADRAADEYEVEHIFHLTATPLIRRPVSLQRKVLRQIPQPVKDAVKTLVGKQ